MMRNSVRYDDEEDETNLAFKTYEFHSHAGKVRLSRIWNDLRLSKELLFSTWTAGHGEALLRERVTEYMYNFLQNRFKRFGSKNKFEKEFSAFEKSGKKIIIKATDAPKPKTPNLVELEYERYLSEHSAARALVEERRTFQLYLKGLLKPTSHSRHIRGNPIYRLNILNKRIRSLERDFDEQLQNPILFEAAWIKPSRAEYHSQHDRCPTSEQVEELQDEISTFEKTDGRSTFSSGFQEELTPSPRILQSRQLKSVSEEEDSLLESSDSDSNTNLTDVTAKYIKPTTPDPDQHSESRESSPNYEEDDSSFDTLGLEMESAWTSPLITSALNQDKTATRFVESEKVISMYRRKLARAEIFAQDLGLFLNNYFD